MGAVPGASSLLEGLWQFEKLWRVKLDRLQSGQTGITSKALQTGPGAIWFYCPSLFRISRFPNNWSQFLQVPAPLIVGRGTLLEAKIKGTNQLNSRQQLPQTGETKTATRLSPVAVYVQ